MRVQSLALLAGATTAIAAETVTLFLPGFDSQDLVGKVLGTVCGTLPVDWDGTNCVPERQGNHLSSQLPRFD